MAVYFARPSERGVITLLRPLSVSFWMFTEIVGRRKREDALVSVHHQHPFQQAAALVVEKIFIPAAFHQFGDHHHDASIGMLHRKIENGLNQRSDHEAIGRSERHQFWQRITRSAEWSQHIAFP